jgi:sec-independent protein translocase protein TatC
MAFIIQNTNMEGQINILVWTCITAGFILAFPFILWQIWQFISPALYEKEKKHAKLFVFTSSILFFMGVLFGYFVIVPMSVNFFATFTVSDVIKNQLDKDGREVELGLDQRTGILYANKDFMMNCVNYLLDDNGLINIRSKEVNLPILDKEKVYASYTQSQVITVAVPIFILLLFGIAFTFLRKRNYSK